MIKLTKTIKQFIAVGFITAAVAVINAAAATFTVTNTNDSGAGSLHQAILDANTATTADTIAFDSSFDVARTITLAGTALTITGSATNTLTINGPGRQLLTISANNTSRVFIVNSNATVTINGVTVGQGNGTGTVAGFGGAVYSNGILTMTNCNVTASTATSDGGGIYIDTGTLNLSNCLISNNTATRSGGGLALDVATAATVSESTFMTNSALSTNPSNGTGGGGIYLSGAGAGTPASIGLTDSTVSGNNTNAGASGGGVHLATRAIASLTNTTISGNAAAGDGGGISGQDSPITLTNSTVSGNSLAGGIVTGTQNVTNFRGSIIANNVGGANPDISGPFTSLGYNLIRNTAGATITGTTAGNITGQDPLLSPLANTGGNVLTHLIGLGSPALDAGDSANFPLVDSRGFARAVDGDGNGSVFPDIGAFERRPGILQFSSPTFSVLENIAGGLATVIVSRVDGADGDVSIQYSTSDGTAIGGGNDYAAANGTVSFGNQVTNLSFTVPIVPDTVLEPDETINLVIFGPALGAKLGSPSTSVLTIINDDAPVTVSGRVTTPAGQNIRNVVVSLIDSQGLVCNATTSSFGLYSFENVPAGDTYTIRVASKRYRFTPKVMQIITSLTNVDFVGLE